MFKINILKFLFLIICLKILPLFIQDESELRKKRAVLCIFALGLTIVSGHAAQRQEISHKFKYIPKDNGHSLWSLNKRWHNHNCI